MDCSQTLAHGDGGQQHRAGRSQLFDHLPVKALVGFLQKQAGMRCALPARDVLCEQRRQQGLNLRLRLVMIYHHRTQSRQLPLMASQTLLAQHSSYASRVAAHR